MIASFIAKKLRQTQYFDAAGRRWPVTVLEAGPCPVVQVKSVEKDGYDAVQLGFGAAKRLRKPQEGHAKSARLSKTPRFLREIRLSDADGDVNAGMVITLDQVFAPGDEIAVTGTSKGKGWAGAIKRYHFRGGPATHGQSDRERAPGSVGGTTTPGRVYKGQRMAGRMGQDTVTVKGLKVMAVDSEKNLLTVSGLVPGAIRNIVIVKRVSEQQEITKKKEEPQKESEKVQDTSVDETMSAQLPAKEDAVKSEIDPKTAPSEDAKKEATA